MGVLDDLLPVRRIVHANVVQEFARDLSFDSTQFGVAIDTVKRLATVTVLAAGITLVGDVTGPGNNTKVEKLSGLAGVVNFPIGNKLTSTGASNVGDIITTSAGQLLFGNTTTGAAVTVQSNGNVIVQATGAASFVKITAPGGGGSSFVYLDGDAQIIRKGDGTEGFRFVPADPSLRFDSGSGTFPAFGLMRFKESGGNTLIAHNYSSTDYGVLSVLANSVTLGARHNNANPCATVYLNPAGSGNIFFTYGSTTHWQFTDTGGSPAYAITAYREDSNWQIMQRQRVGNNPTKLSSLIGQPASSTATGANVDGGSVIIRGGDPTGGASSTTDPYGDVPVASINAGRTVKAMADANQALTASESQAWRMHTTGALTADRTLTLTRRPTSGNILIITSACTGGFNVQVGFLTGTRVNVGDGQTWLIEGDGTNAVGTRLA